MHTPAQDSLTDLGLSRPRLDADIVCVGFGPATAGFLTTFTRGLLKPDGSLGIESPSCPGSPPQILCYERADDIGFAVSGLVTRGRAIRQSFPAFDPAQIPLGTRVTREKVIYLLDPTGASRRSWAVRALDGLIRSLKLFGACRCDALELPWIPSFLHKGDGFILSLGQFNQWVGNELLGTGLVQIWPGTPVSHLLLENGSVRGVQLLDQGTDRQGRPESAFLPGLEVSAALTVVGDGPVGSASQQLDEALGLPEDREKRDWAVGMKFVVDLPESCALEPGTVLHTLGFPEPEIFGFLYVHPERVASLGIFVPSSFRSPVRNAYRYLQHWMLHPYLWRHLKGGRLRSWGAKTLQESGKRGEPFLVGDGFARIGENSGTTNVLTGSGVDEAWLSGVLLGESALELLRQQKPFTRGNLQATYVRRRRDSWLERESCAADAARDGFQRGFLSGLCSMALTGLTRGRLKWRAGPNPKKAFLTLAEYYRSRISPAHLERLEAECAAQNRPLHNSLMEAAGWPAIPYDGQLLISQQDALLLGGKVQAAPGYADHVRIRDPQVCRACATKLCLEICSGQAIGPGPDGIPSFDREKCIHCGACLWNCAQAAPNSRSANLEFRAGAGGLHSAEN